MAQSCGFSPIPGRDVGVYAGCVRSRATAEVIASVGGRVCLLELQEQGDLSVGALEKRALYVGVG